MNLFSEPSLDELASTIMPSPRLMSSLAPPLHFEVYDVRQSSNPHRATRSRPTAAQKQGLRYEQRAKGFLRSLYPSFVDGPWLSYRRLADHQRRFCQPDGFVFEDGGRLTIFEIKYRWCADAATQLALYRATLGVLLSPRESRCVCVTRSFDPAVRFEGRAHFIDDPSRRDSAADSIGIFIWK